MQIGESTPLTQQQEGLKEGLANLAPGSSITFTEYTIYRFSEDGYVFLVKGTSTLSVTFSAIHIATERDQEIDNTIGMNSVVLDTQTEINEFNTVNPTSMWIADIAMPDGTTIPVAFQRYGPFFANAGVYHYAGFAVFPQFGNLIVAASADLPTAPIVSNSLPIWLTQNSIANVYPSFLVPENIQPPYVVAHIEPELTKPLQPVPYYVWTSTGTGFANLASYQLYYDYVQLILYGFTNAMALQFQAGLISTSIDDETFGFSGEQISLRDDKTPQPEIAALAMKKTLSFGASYYQNTADAIARRLIVSATVQYS